MLTDSHIHLYSEQYDNDRDEVIKNALTAGVTNFYLPSIDSAYTQSMFKLEERYPENMHLMMGLHPTHVEPSNMEKELEHVKNWLDKRSFAAVGEIGIDLYWDRTHLKEQQYAFSQQIDWAIEKDLPIVIHCRESFHEIFEILEVKKSPHLRGILHCFSGDKEQAEKAISYNLKLGIGGVVTFKNGKIDQFLSQIDLQHIVLETDGPYLAPVPYRGKRNLPEYLPIIAEKVAALYNLPVETIIEQTTKNAQEVFGKS